MLRLGGGGGRRSDRISRCIFKRLSIYNVNDLIVLRNSFGEFCLSYSNIRHVDLIWAVAFLALAPLQILTSV